MHRSVATFMITCLALLGPCGAASSVLAAETRHLGNTDGKAFTAACPDGLGIMGFAYNYSNAQLLAVALPCRQVTVEHDGPAAGGIRLEIDPGGGVKDRPSFAVAPTTIYQTPAGKGDRLSRPETEGHHCRMRG